jgi:DNA processing protein
MVDREAAAFHGLAPDDIVLERGQPGYPPLLAATADAPPYLFVRGAVQVLNLPAIAIVGSRQASREGRARAHRLAYLLAKRGFAVASGLARGIDTSAHIGALDAGGTTFAVIGTPLNRCYPSENAELQCRIARAGAVVPHSRRLPRRSRTAFPYAMPR